MKRRCGFSRLRSVPSYLVAGLLAFTFSSPARAQVLNADDVPRLVASVEFRIGSLDDPSVGFSNIGAVAVGPDRRIYVVERQDREVRVLREDGTPVQIIGGPGEGPGEFANRPGELGFIGDTLWVRDPQPMRVHLFSTSGEVLGGFASTRPMVNVGLGTSVLVDLMMARDGRLLLTPRQGVIVKSTGQSLPDSATVPVLRLDRGETSGETLQEISMYVAYESPPGGIPQADLILDPWPFAEGPMRRWTAEGSILIEQPMNPSRDSASFVISRRTLAGDLVFQRVLSYAPQRLDRAAVEAWLNPTEDLVLPDFRPAITDAVPGEDGSIWLRRDLGETDQQTWLLLGPDGALLGQVTLPESYELRWVGSDEAYAVEKDEFDVPWLVRLSVR